MEHDGRIAGKIKSQDYLFCPKDFSSIEEAIKEVCIQMLHGIQVSKDVKFSNIARSLNEEIPLIKLGKKVKLNFLLKKIFEKAKRFFEIPEFKQYAVADGIYKILFASRTGILSALITKQNEGQLLFSFATALT
jgi:hypothetical protein